MTTPGLEGGCESLPAAFGRTVREHPDRVAVACGTDRMTYSDLDRAANRLAHRLIAIGDPGDRVALLLPHDRLIFVALLAVLKAGRIIVVLNPGDPLPRHHQLLDDCQPVAVLTTADLLAQAGQIGGARSPAIDVAASLHGFSETAPEMAIDTDAIGQLVYTSGSTGRPKGVMKSHGHSLFNGRGLWRALDLTPDDRIALVASLWGGQGANTMWTALLGGATLAVFPATENGVTGVGDWINEAGVTIFASASSLFRHLTRTLSDTAEFPSVRVVKLSADAATWQDIAACARHFPNARVMNAMGSAEVGNLAFAMISSDGPLPKGPLPVGRCFDGLEIRILDDHGRNCPAGTVGAITVRGRHLATGYWRDADLTASHFAVDPDGWRTFRSADLGRVDGDGMLVLAGRSDLTYKIRGQRVDIAEAEKGLSELPGVDAAAVVAVPGPRDELQLVAYVVPRPGAQPSIRKLRSVSRGTMPRHLVPSLFVVLEDLPRTGNSKIDRQRLREIVPSARREPAPPVTDTEKLLIRLWEEAFDIEVVGRLDDFFDLGGDSLIAATIAARLHASYGIELGFDIFVDHPVLAEAAATIETMRDVVQVLDDEPLVAVPRDHPIPLSLLQEPYWRSRPAARSGRQTRVGVAQIDGPLDVAVLRDSLDRVVARHELLRTRFSLRDGVPVQVVEPARAVPMAMVDLSGAEDAEVATEDFLRGERSRVFDLQAAPAVVFTLVRLREDRYLFVRANHHILPDAPSWNLFFRDLAEIYEARIADEEPSLPALPVQYADFSVWQRRAWRRDGERFMKTFEWWKEQFLRPDLPEAVVLKSCLRDKPAGALTTSDWRTEWGFDLATSERLDALGREESATYYVVRLAALVPVLALAAGHDAVVVGGVFANRSRAEVERVFGLFANAALMIFRLDRSVTFREHVGRVRRHVLDVQSRAGLPWALLVREMRREGIKVPPIVLWMHMPTPLPPLRFAGLELNWDNSLQLPMEKGIVVRFDERQEQDHCLLTYDARLYAPEKMNGLVDNLVRFIREASLDPDATVGALIERAGIASVK
ncbi:AMP-binding protein [Bauldia litoralis]|uniref:AMP-binding protein n=1 Tax=Bauldia litoralis TaxID=665467 RepID=UPI00326699D0